MDLTNLWQEHRIFITSVVAGLLVFLIGQAIISNVYPIADMKRQVATADRALRRLETPSTSQLEEARQLNEEIKSQFDKAVEFVNFIPEEQYLLSKKEKPDIQYDRLYNEGRNALVEFAKTLNITVAPNLGMPELSPTRRSEIQRALIALDIVTRVVLIAIESQVSQIDSISMVPVISRRKKSFIQEQSVRFKMLGSTEAMAQFLKRLALQENFLALEEADFRMADKDGASVTANFTVSAMTVIKEESET
jgi:hypothetical protein